MKKPLFISMLLLIALNTSAEEEKKLYKWIDKEGNTHYTDQPQKGAEEIEMKLAPVTKMLSPNYKVPAVENNKSVKTDDVSYELGFINPTKDGVVRDNSNSVSLEALVNPPLQSDHTIRFFVDGNLVSAEAGATSVTATEIEFGEHSVNFIVVDSEGKLIQTSETVHFHLLNRVNPKIKKQQQNNPN